MLSHTLLGNVLAMYCVKLELECSPYTHIHTEVLIMATTNQNHYIARVSMVLRVRIVSYIFIGPRSLVHGTARLRSSVIGCLTVYPQKYLV